MQILAYSCFEEINEHNKVTINEKSNNTLFKHFNST